MTGMCLAMLGFVAPWMAWGAVAAVGLPVLAHLLSKTRYREVAFPAARLVQQAVAATSRIETPRHRLLMVLRWLVLMLLVLAFMRPQWTPDAEAGSDPEQGLALVLLIDASASMQRTQDGATLYDRALREAKRLINQLDPTRDVAAVIRIDHAPASLLPEPTAQFSLLTQRLNNTQPGYTHANWPAAMTTAQRILADDTRAVRVVTISDQQGDQPDVSFMAYGNAGAGIDHVRIDGPSDNTAVRLIDVRPYPAIAGRPMTAIVEVQHFGDKATQISLTAWANREKTQQTITLSPNEKHRLEFDLPPSEGSFEVIQVAIEPRTSVDLDDLAGMVIPVRDSSVTLIVHDAGRSSQRLAHRLAMVLNPGEIKGETLPEVQRVTADRAEAAIDQFRAAGLRTIVLLNEGPLTDAASQAIESFAQSGGGVIQFMMDNRANVLQTSQAVGIDFEIEPLELFEGPSRAGLSALDWPGVSNTPIDERAQPILMDEMERVIVAEMSRGRGRLIAINAALSPEPGGLLAEPAFVVLFNELCRYASPGPAPPGPNHPGDPFPYSLREGMRAAVAGPYQWPTGVEMNSDVFTVPGLYAAFDGDAADESVYVTIDPAESDTRPTPIWADISATPSLEATTSAGPNHAIDTTLRNNPIELWPYLVFGVLGLLAAESLLLRQFAGPRSTALQGGAA